MNPIFVGHLLVYARSSSGRFSGSVGVAVGGALQDQVQGELFGDAAGDRCAEALGVLGQVGGGAGEAVAPEPAFALGDGWEHAEHVECSCPRFGDLVGAEDGGVGAGLCGDDLSGGDERGAAGRPDVVDELGELAPWHGDRVSVNAVGQHRTRHPGLVVVM